MVYQFKLDVLSGHLLFHKCLYGDKMTKNIHRISVAILAVFLTENVIPLESATVALAVVLGQWSPAQIALSL